MNIVKNKPLFLIHILLLGDSHSMGHYGKELNQLLGSDGNFEVSSIAVCGSTPRWFFNEVKITCGESEKLKTVSEVPVPIKKNQRVRNIVDWLNYQKPSMVVVSLGTNFLNYQSSDSIQSEIKKMAETIKNYNAKCLWVGPPDLRIEHREKLKVINSLIQTTVKSHCDWFDSTKVTQYPDGEIDKNGLHYYTKGQETAKKWAKAVYERVIYDNSK